MSVSITQRSSSSSSIALSQIEVYTGNGSGAVNTVIRRFTNSSPDNTGSDITYADSALDGATFTINTSGLYAISYTDETGNSQSLGISRNSNQLTTSIASITAANRVQMANMVNGSPACVSAVLHLNATDVIRAHNSTGLSSTQDYVQFRIVRIS